MSKYRHLAEFLLSDFDDKQALATTVDNRVLSIGQWLQRFQAWQQVIRNQTADSWAIFEEDCFEFSAILFALWANDKKVYLASNTQPEYLSQLSNYTSHFVGSIGQVPDGVTYISSFEEASSSKDLSEVNQYSKRDAFVRLKDDVDCLFIFTSGSSGQPQAVAKNLDQLSAELNTLHRYWGDQATDRHIVASVSHQHIYGLLFRCLWPLLEGWSFDTHSRQYSQSLVTPGRIPSLLISSPTHLSRLPHEESRSTEFDKSFPDFDHVFCSGAPLQRSNSLQATAYFKTQITEILGSTETGGIAWREQASKGSSAWTCFDCVDFTIAPIDNTLTIRSPYLSPANHWYKTEDCATLVDGRRFHLNGRADRIIKVEGKRLSLDEMENQLKRHPLVNDARLLALPESGGRVGAAICIQEPRYRLTRERRKELTSLLNTFLLQHFERVVLPKKWRFLNRLPKNSQSKISMYDMKNIFEESSKRPRFAEVISSIENDNQLSLDLKVPENLLYFDGHFDQAAILPGVVQAQWAEFYARNHYKITQDFLRLEVLKFQKVVTPGTTINLQLQYKPENNKVSFKYMSDAGQHASGRIVFEA